MSDFNFSATAQCDYCGNLMSDSEQECDECGPADRRQHFFRAIGSTEPKTLVVQATMSYKWHRLEREVGDSWIAYDWLGPRQDVENMVGRGPWDDIGDIPRRQHSTEAPSDVGK